MPENRIDRWMKTVNLLLSLVNSHDQRMDIRHLKRALNGIEKNMDGKINTEMFGFPLQQDRAKVMEAVIGMYKDAVAVILMYILAEKCVMDTNHFRDSSCFEVLK